MKATAVNGVVTPFVNGVKIDQKCLGNISKGFTVDNVKETGITGYVYDC